MGTPQKILIVLMIIDFVWGVFKYSTEENGCYQITGGLIEKAILIWILISGGFFD